MTYEQWVKEMNKGRGTELQAQKKIITDAAANCSPQTKDKLNDFLLCLDNLFSCPAIGVVDSTELFSEQEDRKPVSRELFEALSSRMGSEFASMLEHYDPPMELLSKPGVLNAMGYIFNELGMLDNQYAVPDFKRTEDRDAAYRKDTDTYAAQVMAMKDLKDQATLRQCLTAAASIFRWKKDPGFKNAMKDRDLTIRLLQDEDSMFFLRDMQFSLDQYEKDNAKTFRQISEDIAKQYRENKNYVQLENYMNALRAVAATKEQDQTKWDDVKITPTEFRKMVGDLQAAVKSEKTPEEYQAELAGCVDMKRDHIAGGIYDVYGPVPVFHKEFVVKEDDPSGYTKKSFDKHLKSIDISGINTSGGGLSPKEFGSLAFLSVIDPKIAGGAVSIGGKSVHIEDGTIDIALGVLLSCSIAFGNEVKRIGGKTLYGPENRVGETMGMVVAPARKKAFDALKEWDNNNIEPLAKIIADGINNVVTGIQHIQDGKGALNQHTSTYSIIVKDTVGLLKRCKPLADAAERNGLKKETLQEMEGIIMANDIENAGVEAGRRLAECAKGLKVMDDFEREQCLKAALRYKTMMDDIKAATKAWDSSEEYAEYTNKIDNINEELESKFGSEYKKKAEAQKEHEHLQFKYIHEQNLLMKRPPVYKALGKEGVLGLDKMVAESSLSMKKASSMSYVELVQELGLVEKSKMREIRTTAKDIYDQLTKKYKAHQMDYTQYEAHIRTMRELTGGNKNAKIDLKAIEDAIEAKLNKSLGPVEEEIHKLTADEYGGRLGQKLKTIYDTYGPKPTPDERSLNKNKYTKEEFAQLEEIEGAHLKLGRTNLGQSGFAALSVAATQAYPEIGGICWIGRAKSGMIVRENGIPVYDKIVEKPTYELAASIRTMYTCDLDNGPEGARAGIGAYIGSAIAPARRKANEALLAYSKTGDPKEIGKIIGMGIHNTVPNTMLADTNANDFNEMYVTEGGILGKLASLAEADEKVKAEVLKYTNEEELLLAKGMGMVYDIAHGARIAREKLEAHVSGEKELTDLERKACIELMLRGKAMSNIAEKQSAEKYTEEISEQFTNEFTSSGDTSLKGVVLFQAQMGRKIAQTVGLPEYVKGLAKNGPKFALDLLDQMMPNRAAFMDLKDEEILKAIKANPRSNDDPFTKEEYRKKHVRSADEVELRNMMRAIREKQSSSPQIQV